MTTVNDLTDAAWKKCGIISPDSTQDSTALESLNNMISQWGIDFVVPATTREDFALTIGTSEYTIGSGGDFDTVRPIAITSAYLKDSDGYDYPVEIFSGKEYDDISFKTFESRPTKLFFSPDISLAKIKFNSEPEAAYTAYFEFWKNFTEFDAIDSTVSLPNEYKEAIIYNLAIKLGEDESIDLPMSVFNTAQTSLALISRLVYANRLPPKAKFDFNDGGPYNVTTGE